MRQGCRIRDYTDDEMVSSPPNGVTMRQTVSAYLTTGFEEKTMNQCNVIGLDTAKSIFHMVEVNQKGKELHRKKLRRNQVLAVFTQMTPAIIAMESCSGAHYWARRFAEAGPQVKLLPAQHVKGYLRGQ